MPHRCAGFLSHDETIHVYHNSWSLYTGQGYRHDPLSHGPFQFHLVALSYFLFGANDMTARIPAALFSIASVAFVWFYKRYLGKSGMFIAMLMMLISPILDDLNTNLPSVMGARPVAIVDELPALNPSHLRSVNEALTLSMAWPSSDTLRVI
jgi:hypothetical protein